ncbi:EAL domain-containing protein [Devosia sp. PTR5]|uniref:EAL domain-containing protein n=1 Tax=Devosia oryzisoli TaxID=2774138 RepID=A0A927FTY0_9HYPH|nr:EAL domain-containing protein [Devosia oryzisoli]
MIRRIFRIVFKPPDTPELALAQWNALSRQIPLLYIMLLANTWVLALTHFGRAPRFLTLYIPSTLTVVGIVRTSVWLRGRNAPVSAHQALRALRGPIWIAGTLAVGFTAWSLSLYGYGDAYMQSHVAFYMGVTTIGCMFCLMHVRAAAFLVGVVALLPFSAFFAISGQQTLVAIAINMVLVVAGLGYILVANNSDFAELVASRAEMARRQAEAQRLLTENVRLASTDALTGLPNQRSFELFLTHALAEEAAGGAGVAVAIADIDRFKSINQIFGQLAGDSVIVEMGHRLEKLRRPDSFVARLEGNRFGLVLRGDVTPVALNKTSAMIGHALHKAFDVPAGVIRLSTSLGLAVAEAGDTAAALYDRADYATSVAKREAQGSAVIFGCEHALEIRRVRQMEHLLHTADLEQEIHILLQPQFDISQGQTTGFEVLARWRSPVLGEVSPAEFVPMAERTGQITRITQTILRKALTVTATLPRPLRVSVNLSANDIGSPSAIDGIVSLVREHAGPCRIDFEITETALMRDLAQANQSLLALLGLGARIALDDFGTGHSSLTHVQKLPLHRIKIDRSFVAEVTTDTASRAIIKTVIDLCRNLGISCVFEGIETEEQLDGLIGLGGTVMQGYLFGRPMTPQAALDHLKAEDSYVHSARRDHMMGVAG